MVVDASALLAVLFEEPQAGWAADQMEAHAGALRMSTVNLRDCFAYALAKAEGCSVLAIDEDFRRLDVQVVLPPNHTDKKP